MTAEFIEYNPSSESRYSARIGHEEWERHRKKFTRLHGQNISRKQMLQIMKREDGFCPSLAQLNGRFKHWGLQCYEKSTPRSTPKSTSRSASKSTPASQDPNRGQSQLNVSSTTNLMEHLEHLDHDHDLELNHDRDLEGIGEGFGKVQYDGADNAAVDLSGIHLEDPEPSCTWLDGSSRQSHDQIVGTSGYPGRQDIPLPPSDEETSSSSGLVILTPGTNTPSQATSSSFSNQLARIPAANFDTDNGHNGEVHYNHATGISQAAPRAARPTASSPYAILQMPTDLKITDDLLRCVSGFASLMLGNREKRPSPPSFLLPRQLAAASPQSRDHIHRQHIRWCINTTAEAYENAHYFLKLGRSDKASQRLQNASSTVAPMFAKPDLFLLTRLVEIATWSSWKKFPQYEPIVFQYLSHEAGAALGSQHPLTVLLACFSQAAAISTSYPSLWTCIIDHIDRIADDLDPASRSETQQIRIKAYFYLVRVLRNNREHVEAIQRCGELIQLCITIDGARSFSANRARYNLAVNHCEAGDLHSAMLTYQEARKYLGSKKSPHDGWVFAVFASSELAQLHEQEGQMEEAAKYYEEAFLRFLECGGDESSGALLMLKDLIEFHQRLNDQHQLDRIKRQYPACCTSLEIGTLDHSRLWIGRRVTTQASGGKRWRAWTWTSPLT